MICCGVDPSLSSTGIAILENEKLIFFKTICSNPEQPLIIRINSIVNEIEELIDKYHIEKFGIESPILFMKGGSKGVTILSLYGLNIAIQLMLFRKEIEYKVINVRTLRKRMFGSGNIKKEIVFEKIKKMFPKILEFKVYNKNGSVSNVKTNKQQNDIADATAVAFGIKYF